MSKESVQEFFKAVENDQGLAQRLRSADSPEDIVKLAEESGYSFTVEDLQAIYAEEGLTQEQLDAASGGRPPYCTSKGCYDRG
ncbi:MAG: Nif11-like leader peptide family natural product precursor [Nostoc sp.]|uniref:Nif11-like leader peptide family natural product precursor n=1 Tax=Nostoc sp. TaxID=1180 RepID=UPI002FFC3D30